MLNNYRLIDPYCVITRSAGDKGILFHHRRELDDGQLLLLVNSSIEHPASGFIEAQAAAVELWDFDSGTIRGYPSASSSTGLQASFELPPSGSLLLFLPRTGRSLAPAPRLQPGISVPPSTPLEVQRLGPNVLTLDFVTLTAGGQTLSNAYYYAANQFAFRKNCMERNPWDSAVQ